MMEEDPLIGEEGAQEGSVAGEGFGYIGCVQVNIVGLQYYEGSVNKGEVSRRKQMNIVGFAIL